MHSVQALGVTALLVLLAGCPVTSAQEACQAMWGQCGGESYDGPECCVPGSACVYNSKWYSQCVPGANGNEVPLYYQCGGKDWDGPTNCATGSLCVESDEYYSQCVPKPTKSRVCIFDFDDTIKVHQPGTGSSFEEYYSGRAGASTKVKPGKDALGAIEKCIEMGYGVAIATASCEVDFVKSFLNKKVDGDIFSNAMLSSSRFQSCQPRKTPALKSILSAYDMSGFPECAVLFDDKNLNGKYAREAEVNFVKVDPKYGVSWDDFWQGMSMLDRKCP